MFYFESVYFIEFETLLLFIVCEKIVVPCSFFIVKVIGVPPPLPIAAIVTEMYISPKSASPYPRP